MEDQKISYAGLSKVWHDHMNPEVLSSHFWNRQLKKHLITFQQNLDEFRSIFFGILLGTPKMV